jgi:hypothetical protein
MTEQVGEIGLHFILLAAGVRHAGSVKQTGVKFGH